MSSNPGTGVPRCLVDGYFSHLFETLYYWKGPNVNDKVVRNCTYFNLTKCRF